jgi:hypothetical protein
MKNKNEWEAPSQEEQQLMVMRAKIEEMKQTKAAQGQRANLMRKLADRVSSKIKASKRVNTRGSSTKRIWSGWTRTYNRTHLPR